MIRVSKRRRTEGKTDYLKRKKLLKSGAPRVVFRKTNKYILAQYVISVAAQDKVEISLTSKSLLKYGWPKEAENSLKSIPAAYLTGYLMGKTILKDKKKTPILDFGMYITLHKTKIYGFLKGLIDSGVNIKISAEKEIFPSEERIKGEQLKTKIDLDKIKANIK